MAALDGPRPRCDDGAMSRWPSLLASTYLSLGLCLSSCGGGATEPTTATASPRRVSNAGSEVRAVASGPRLVRITDSDTTVYLFGTVHMLHPSTTWMDARIEEAFASADAVYFEVPTDPAAMAPFMGLLQQLAANPPGTTLSSLLPAAARDRAYETSARLGVPFGQLEPMRPWIAAITLMMTALSARGIDPDAGVDRILAARASQRGQTVRYLETIDTQLRAIGGLPVPVQVELFVETLDDVEQSAEEMEALTEAWRHGDITRLETELVGEMRAEAPALYDAILVQRNRAWVDELALLMEREAGTFFVAAGAAHFVGPDAVQSGLAARGLSVSE